MTHQSVSKKDQLACSVCDRATDEDFMRLLRRAYHDRKSCPGSIQRNIFFIFFSLNTVAFSLLVRLTAFTIINAFIFLTTSFTIVFSIIALIVSFIFTYTIVFAVATFFLIICFFLTILVVAFLFLFATFLLVTIAIFFVRIIALDGLHVIKPL